MGVSLKKGGNVSLTKAAPGLNNVHVGLQWKPRKTDGQKWDLDASAFMLNADGKVRSDADFIFYENKESVDGAVSHKGDNRNGEGEGDDEVIKIDLSKVPTDVDKIAIAVTIHEAEQNGQHFGDVDTPFIRILNDADQAEIARYDLAEDSAGETAMIFGELYRYSGEWKFRAVGQGFAGGLGPLATKYGVHVD
jgi:tellurium resistance protein TerD